MNKLWLIIRREYLVRVKKKAFLLVTLLTPLGLGIFFFVIGLIFSYQSDSVRTIGIVDPSGIMGQRIKDENNFFFQILNSPLDSAIISKSEQIDGILYLPEFKRVEQTDLTVYYYSDDALDLEDILQLENIIRAKIREYKIDLLELDRDRLEILATDVRIDPEPLVQNEDSGNNPSPITSVVGAAIGGIMGFLMYMIVFINGMMVMKSVMEEKTNRIVEIVISSVKPFQLMLGKIIGIGGVGLTQIAIWAVIIPLLYLLAQVVFGWQGMSSTQQMPAEMQAMDPEEMEMIVAQTIAEINQLNWWIIIPCFVIFFVGGYILYAAFFAAVGSAMSDDLGSSQSLTIPITIPIVLALYIMFVAIRVPNSTLAVLSSIFPLFSPIVMPARIAFSPPAWQLILSIVLLVATVFFAVWISARIYRIGILSYGKKVTFKEMIKWMRQSN